MVKTKIWVKDLKGKTKKRMTRSVSGILQKKTKTRVHLKIDEAIEGCTGK